MKLSYSASTNWWHPLCFCFVPFFSLNLSRNWQRRIIKSTKRGGFYGALERDGSERAEDDAERAKDGGGGVQRAN
jgi:hypothetical protein